MNILSVGIMAIATAFMIFVIWSKSMSKASRATRFLIALGYLILMVVAIFLEKH